MSDRRHFIPDDAELDGLAFEGTPVYTDVWNPDLDRYEIRLMADFTFILPWRDLRITIHQGFVCDGASIPKRFWDSIGPPYASRYKLAAVLHDVMYAAELLDRDICDHIFLDVMKRLGVEWWRRTLMWLAVRIGGRRPWKRHTRESIGETKKLVTATLLSVQSDLFNFVTKSPSQEVTRSKNA